MHEVCGDAGAQGEGTVVRGTSWASRLIGAFMGFPPAGTYPVHVAFAEEGGVERWTRDFGGHFFSSELSGRDGLLFERFGPMRFGFALPSDARGLTMQLRRWSVLRVPLPRGLAPRIAAREWQEENGRFGFDVRVAMPLVGPVVRYSGWLSPLGGPRKPASEAPALVRPLEEAAA
jgi:hypothetical protein